MDSECLGGEEEKKLKRGAGGGGGGGFIENVGVTLRCGAAVGSLDDLGGEEEKMLNKGAEEGFEEEEKILLNVGVEGREGGLIC